MSVNWPGKPVSWNPVVIGCESGPSRRPCPDEWLDDVAAQCKDAGVPCFIKQRSVNGKVVHATPPADWPWTR